MRAEIAGNIGTFESIRRTRAAAPVDTTLPVQLPAVERYRDAHRVIGDAGATETVVFERQRK